MEIASATSTDIPALVKLMNSAYRGEASKQGWTTEANLVDGEQRTDEKTLDRLMHAPHAVILKCQSPTGEITGCVYLQKRDNKLYLGMLSVSPLLQAKGIGKTLMLAAENYARSQNCPAIFMRVISARAELIAWYERLGYKKTGVREPFPNDDRFGRALQPIEFAIMEKNL